MPSRERILRGTHQGEFFKAPLDAHSTEHEQLYQDGERPVADVDQYTFESMEQIGLEDTKMLLLTLPELGDVLGLRSR